MLPKIQASEPKYTQRTSPPPGDKAQAPTTSKSEAGTDRIDGAALQQVATDRPVNVQPRKPTPQSDAVPFEHASVPPALVDSLALRMQSLDGLGRDSAAFARECEKLDGEKIAALRALNSEPDVNMAARALATQVETTHGKAGQTKRATVAAQLLLADPKIEALLGAKLSTEQTLNDAKEVILGTIPYLNLGDVEGPTAVYLAQGRPSAEALAIFASRPQRAHAIMTRYGIADPGVRALVQDFHVNAKADRSCAAQVVDLSERIAAMTTSRPQRPGMPAAKVAGILEDLGAKGVFDGELANAAALMLRNDAFTTL